MGPGSPGGRYKRIHHKSLSVSFGSRRASFVKAAVNRQTMLCFVIVH